MYSPECRYWLWGGWILSDASPYCPIPHGWMRIDCDSLSVYCLVSPTQLLCTVVLKLLINATYSGNLPSLVPYAVMPLVLIWTWDPIGMKQRMVLHCLFLMDFEKVSHDADVMREVSKTTHALYWTGRLVAFMQINHCLTSFLWFVLALAGQISWWIMIQLTMCCSSDHTICLKVALAS
jgi:hypothetical protein